MALTYQSIYDRFPEFDLTDPVTGPNAGQDKLVKANLAGAEAQVDRSIFPSVAYADEVVLYLACHLLARSPAAMNARLQKSRGETRLSSGEDIYWPVFFRLATGAQGGLGRTT